MTIKLKIQLPSFQKIPNFLRYTLLTSFYGLNIFDLGRVWLVKMTLQVCSFRTVPFFWSSD